MPHVSRHVPKKKIADKIYLELLAQVTRKGSAKDRSYLYSGLLTPTERIMFSKRLAIICMLGEGFTFEDIQETLRVSPSTIGRIWQAMQNGKYAQIITIVQKEKFLDSILSAVYAVIPRSKFEPRWAWLNEHTKR